MPELPVLSGDEARKAFEKAGWVFVRQSGSHMFMKKPGVRAALSVPRHRELDRGTLRALIRTAGMSVEEFIELLGR